MNYLKLITSLALITWGYFCYGQDSKILNYYAIPDSLTFNSTLYKLSWSSHPNNIYFKEEYLPEGEKAEHFNSMLLIDFLTTELPTNEVIKSQVMAINERKKTDVVCNYQVVKNEQTGEYILDFVLSESSGNSIVAIEWNAYHYKQHTDNAGHRGILLFGISYRAYGSKTGDFLRTLINYRPMIITKLNEYPFPSIQLQR